MLRVLLFQWISLASASDPAVAPKVAGVDCAEGGRARIEAPLGFDGVRVTTAPGPEGAAVSVSVAGGGRWVSLRAAAGGASTVVLGPTETGGPITIAIEPDLDAPAGACVERIELLRAGDVIATIPR